MLPSLETAKIKGVPVRAAVIIVLAGVLAWNLWLRSHLLVQYRTELGGVEHNVVHGIQKIMLGGTLYEDPERPPYDVIQYTPAYYVICAGIGKLLQLQGDDARAIFLVSRSVALVFNLLMAWLVHRCCRLGGAASWSAFMASGFAFASMWEQSFSRMDAMSSAMSVATACLFLQWLVTKRRSALILASATAVIGASAKQSGIVMMAAPTLYLLLSRDRHALRTWGTGVAVLSAMAVMLILSMGTPKSVYQNIILGLRNGFSWQMYAELFRPATYKYIIGWHVLAAIIVVKGMRSEDGTLRFIGISIVLSLAFALITGLKYGSRPSYVHESLVLTFIGVALLLPRIAVPGTRIMTGWAFALYGTLFAAFRTNSVNAWYRVGEPDAVHMQHLRDDLAVRNALVHDMRLTPDDKVFITYREYLEHFLVGQSMLTQKDILQYSKGDLFDLTDFHRAMNDGTIRYVITDNPTGGIRCLDTTYTGWVPVRSVNGRTILARTERP